MENGENDNWKMTGTCQPSNSSDFNVLDLPFFNSIKSLNNNHQYKTSQE